MDVMDLKQMSPDQVVFWQWRFVTINATLVFTWVVMAILVLGSWLVTRKLSTDPQISRWQNLLELIVDGIRKEIAAVEEGRADKEDNVLKMSPHTAAELLSEAWEHSYSREQAAFPLPYIKERKFFPSVGRIDAATGDRNLMCSCLPMELYDAEVEPVS